MLECSSMRILIISTITILLGFINGVFVAKLFFIPRATLISLPATKVVPLTVICGRVGLPDCVDIVATSTATTTSVPETETLTPRYHFATAVIFTTKQTHVFTDGLTITLEAISDSRCKPDVQCIWAGELATTLQITGGLLGTTTATITLGTVRSQSVNVTGYTFMLTDAQLDTASILVTLTPTKVPNVVKNATIATALPTTNPLPLTTNAPKADYFNDDTFAAAVVTIIQKQTNTFRTENELLPLTFEPVLAKNAQAYSQAMLTGNFLSHTDQKGCDISCRFTKDNYQATAWGENLAMMSFTEQPSIEYVADFFMRQWQASSGHRENLLSPLFTHQGISVVRDSTNIYVTVHFARPS